MNIQFSCICGQSFQNTPSDTPLYCPNCQLSFLSPPTSFSSLACLCPFCRVLNPYSLHWNQKIRCLACEKKFVAPNPEEIWEEWQKGEKKRLDSLEKKQKQEHRQQIQNFQKEQTLKEQAWQNQCFQLTEERDQYHQQIQYAFEEKTTLENSLFETQQYLQTLQNSLQEIENQLQATQKELQQNYIEQKNTEATLEGTRKGWEATQKDLEKIEKLLLESSKQQKNTTETLQITEERAQKLQQENQLQKQHFVYLQQELEETQQKISSLQKTLLCLQQEKSEGEALFSVEKKHFTTEIQQKEEQIQSLQQTEVTLKKQLQECEETFQQEQEAWKNQKLILLQHQETQEQNAKIFQKEKEQVAQSNQENQFRFQSFTQEIQCFLQQLESFFEQRFQWLQPRWARFTLERIFSDRDFLAGKKASLSVFGRYSEGERVLLLETLNHLKEALACEIKFQYQQAIQISTKKIQDLQKKIPLVEKKLYRFTISQKEWIETLNSTTAETLDLLFCGSDYFLQELKPVQHQVPYKKWIQTANAQFQHFCEQALQIHQDFLQEIVSAKFKILYTRFPQSKMQSFLYPTTSFNSRIFQASMHGKQVLELPKQLTHFLPILFLSYWPNPKWALSLYHRIILQEAQPLLFSIFQAQLKLTQEVVRQFQTQQLQQIQLEYDTQIEKQKRFILLLHSEKEVVELQKSRFSQRLQDLEQIQKGILLLLQDLENPVFSEKNYYTFESISEQFRQKMILFLKNNSGSS